MINLPRSGTTGLLFVLLLQSGLINTAKSQKPDYKNIFGNDWQKALSFVEENKSWIKPQLEKYNISFSSAIAIVFPELVRYSAVRDKIEITLLKTLYVNLGEEYANFSIGPFQMKPSFAERIREMTPDVLDRKSKKLFKERSGSSDDKIFRASIVNDLEDPKTELNYLIAFIKICESKFRLNKKDEYSRLKFLATAYNFGFYKTAEQIESMIEKKYFNTRLFKTENYCYADISLFCYNIFRENENNIKK
jgi:hypothetical protein